MIRPSRLVLTTAVVLTLTASGAGVSHAAPPPAADNAGGRAARASAGHWATDAWRSFAAMVEPETGLPADNIGGNLDPASRSAYTSPTNVASYMWSAIVAEKLRVIGEQDEVRRI